MTVLISLNMEQLANPIPCVILVKKHFNVCLQVWEAGT